MRDVVGVGAHPPLPRHRSPRTLVPRGIQKHFHRLLHRPLQRRHPLPPRTSSNDRGTPLASACPPHAFETLASAALASPAPSLFSHSRGTRRRATTTSALRPRRFPRTETSSPPTFFPPPRPTRAWHATPRQWQRTARLTRAQEVVPPDPSTKGGGQRRRSWKDSTSARIRSGPPCSGYSDRMAGACSW